MIQVKMVRTKVDRHIIMKRIRSTLKKQAPTVKGHTTKGSDLIL